MSFSFGASAQPTTPDGTVVGKVKSRKNKNDDFMALLAKAFEQMMGQKPESTKDKLGALRNDPIGDANKQKYIDSTSVNNQFIPGYGSSLGPNTAASGMTPEQVARMQGPTAANQWKFPELFKAPRVMPDAPKSDGWVMPGNLGPNKTIFDGQPPSMQPQLNVPPAVPPPSPNSAFNDIRGSAQPTPNSARDDIRGLTPPPPAPRYVPETGEPEIQRPPFNFFNLPPPVEPLPLAPVRPKKKPGFTMPAFGLSSGAGRTFGF